jgi:hypothetical protein
MYEIIPSKWIGVEKQSNIPFLPLGRLSVPVWCAGLLRTLVAMWSSIYKVRGIFVILFLNFL